MRCLILLGLCGALAAADLEAAAAQQVLSSLAEERPAALIGLQILGQANGPNVLTLLDQALASRDYAVREAAIAAAVERGPEVLERLADAMPRRAEAPRRAAQLRLMLPLGERAWPIIQEAVGDPSPQVRRVAAETLSDDKLLDAVSERVVSRVAEKLLEDPDVNVRMAAVAAVASWPAGKKRQGMLVQACVDPAETVVEAAATALRDDEAAIAEVVKRARVGKGDQRARACIALGVLGGDEARGMLARAVRDREWEVRAAACEALAQIANPEDERALLQLLGDRDWAVRACAGVALAKLQSRSAIPLMIMQLGADGGDALLPSLQALTGQRLETQAEFGTWWKQSGETVALPPAPDVSTESEVSFYDIVDSASNINLVIDISGSMDGARLERAKAEVEQLIRGLQPGTHFNLLCFASEVHPWEQGPVRAGWRNKARLLRYIEDVLAGGGTNIHEALCAGLDAHDADLIFMLTDGAPSVGLIERDVIREEVRWHNRGREQLARINVVGIGIPEEAKFLEGLANDNGGRFRQEP